MRYTIDERVMAEVAGKNADLRAAIRHEVAGALFTLLRGGEAREVCGHPLPVWLTCATVEALYHRLMRQLPPMIGRP